MEDWAEICRLHRSEKMSIKMIARVLGISRNTVRAAIASDAAPKYECNPAGSIVDAVEPRIRELLQATPWMPATVIAERIGWTRSISCCRVGRPSCARPSCRRTRHRGRAMRLGRSRSVICGSRRSRCRSGSAAAHGGEAPGVDDCDRLLAVAVGAVDPSRAAPDLLAGWWQVIERLGAVPRTLVWDGEGAIGRWRSGKTELTGECQAFRGTLGAR